MGLITHSAPARRGHAWGPRVSVVSKKYLTLGTERQEIVAPLGKRQNDRYAVKNVGKGT